jgi:putative oxidoreductase
MQPRFDDLNRPGKDMMTKLTLLSEPWVPRAHAALRIVAGYLFVQHGSAKLFGFPHVAMFDNLPVLSLIGFAGILELVGGALLLVGLFVRPVAFLLSGEMAVAYFVGHAPHGHVLLPTLNQGEAAVLYCFVFLFLAAAGAGAWSIDAARSPAAGSPGLAKVR